MDAAEREELRAIVSGLRAQLDEEAACGGGGVPLWVPRAPSATRGPNAPGQAASAAPAAPASEPGASGPSAPAQSVPVAERRQRLAQLAQDAVHCKACALHEKRTQSVFARGNPEAELAFVGEGPGQEEDRLGQPFVGPAGQLLDRMITAMGFDRDEVYVCNVVKCRPPDNRTPRPEEAIACSKFLTPQLELVAPKVVVALGRCAAENLGLAGPSGPWRGRWGSWRGIAVLPTYHPAYLLRSPEQKRVVWQDLQLVMARLGRAPVGRPGTKV